MSNTMPGGENTMSKVLVTVEVELNKLPDDAARELARQVVESRGLNVTKVAIKAESGRTKEFLPKYGKPGSVVTGSDGLAYVVWSDSPWAGQVWATRRDSSDGMFYAVHLRGGYVSRYHGDGQRCDNNANYTGCNHKSHKLALAAS